MTKSRNSPKKNHIIHKSLFRFRICPRIITKILLSFYITSRTKHPTEHMKYFDIGEYSHIVVVCRSSFLIYYTWQVIELIRAAPEDKKSLSIVLFLDFLVAQKYAWYDRGAFPGFKSVLSISIFSFFFFLIKEIPFLRHYKGLECPNDCLSSKKESCVPALPFPRPSRRLLPHTYTYGQIERPLCRSSFPSLKPRI